MFTSVLQTADTYEVALPDLNDLQSTIISLAATVFTIILVVAFLAAFAKRDWGLMIAEFLGAVITAFFVLDSADAVQLLKDIAIKIFVHKS